MGSRGEKNGGEEREMMTDVGSFYLIDYRNFSQFTHPYFIMFHFYNQHKFFCVKLRSFLKLTSKLYAQEKLLYTTLSHFIGN